MSIDIKELFKEIDRLEADNDRLRKEVEFYRLELSINGNGKIIPRENIDLKKSLANSRAYVKKLKKKMLELERIDENKKEDNDSRQGKVLEFKRELPRRKKSKLEDTFEIFKNYVSQNPESNKRDIIINTGITESMLSVILSKFKDHIECYKDPSNRRKRIYSIRSME